MSKIFIDTNILVYTLDSYDVEKKNRARSIVRDVVERDQAVISTQVLQELYVVGTTKLSVEPLLMKNIIRSFENVEIVVIDVAMIEDAIDTSILNRLSFWDSLIITAAHYARCERIFTEDMNQGEIVRGVQIINPFGHA